MKRRKIIALLVAIFMMTAMISGCKSTDSDPSKGKDADKKTTGENVKTDIVIGVDKDLVSLDPHAARDLTTSRALLLLYNGLVDIDPKTVDIIPNVAESWEQPSPTEYIFHIKKGIKFHNGDEVKASDVKFSLERAMASPKVKVLVSAIKQVDVVDEYTVRVESHKPNGSLLYNLSSPYTGILSEKVVTAAGDDYGKNPVGTGPMKYENWAPNNSLKVTRFDDYFLGKPKATSIELRVIPEPGSRTIALETGEIDLIPVVPAIDVKKIKDNADLAFEDRYALQIRYIGMNISKKPFDNVLVRKALNHAIDRQAIVDVVLEGNGLVVDSCFAPNVPGFNKNIKGYEYNTQKAKELLTEAGYPDGFETEFAVSGAELEKIGQLVQADFLKIGVDLSIPNMEWGAYLDYISKDHKMFSVGWGSLDPDTIVNPNFHSANIGPMNRIFYSDPEMDKMIEGACEETDQAKRNEKYQAIQQKVFDEALWIPLHVANQTIAYKKGATGMVVYPDDLRYYDMTVAE